jgi:hypothetical protein
MDSQEVEERLELYRDLRNQALNWTPAKLKLAPAEFADEKTFGALMEYVLPMGDVTATVTVTSFVSGDASLYTSAGFFVIGGFNHERVRAAACNFVEYCNAFQSEMAVTDEFPCPRTGYVRFYALTESNVLTFEAKQSVLAKDESAHGQLFMAGHSLIAELRKVASSREWRQRGPGAKG